MSVLSVQTVSNIVSLSSVLSIKVPRPLRTFYQNDANEGVDYLFIY